MATNTPITVAYGDGIGPEIMAATLNIIKAAGARIEIEEVEIGEKVYLRGISAGIEPSAWESLRRTKVFLKAPITTPQGGGYKSLNVTTRTTFGLYANVRPCVSYYPFVETKHPTMDVVIIRENEEDLYTGIEYRQTHDMVESLKLISRPGSEKIVRYAFEYARSHNRKKVTCFIKDNIMKLTDGLFHKVFNEISVDYPDIENETWIVDIGSAKLADTPEAFDVIVLPNLYGDILSDVAAQVAGSVGLAGSANIGDRCAMFEAIHASAPVTIEHPGERKDLVGVDVFLDWHSGTADELGEAFRNVSDEDLELTMITNRGAKVWPGGMPETFCTDHWRCRFMAPNRGTMISHSQVIALLERVDEAGFDFIKTENLYNFDGKVSYSAVQGE